MKNYYIPGWVDKNIQKEFFFLVNIRRNYSLYWKNSKDIRWSECDDIDKIIDLVKLSKNDIIVVRFFKPQPMSEIYAYLERVIYKDGTVVDYKIESIETLNFIKNSLLFTDITKSFERDKKIEDIL